MALPIETHCIPANIEFFGQLEPFKTHGLPTDCIIFKKLPGFGATFWEIYYRGRNSIIFEPHVPVIVGKQAKNPKVLGVHKKITKAQIKEYLDSDIFPKKIITTPEGYINKVKPVIEKHKKFDLFKDFFALFDECDRLVTDVNYRGRIIAPMNDLFKFEKKALVSATAIEPSDPRFEMHGFKIVKMIPDYDYKKDLKLIATNNIVATLRNQLTTCSKNPVFIFINSTLTIHSIIKLLGIEDDSKVFCAEESVGLLAKLGFTNTSTELGDYSKFNYLTSRFFSAVDIDLPYKPDVIMVTDVGLASHSILDPMTEVIQISGRIRKQEREVGSPFNSLTHITNFKSDIKYKEAEQADAYIRSAYKAYQHMEEQACESSEVGAKDTFTQGMENTEIGDFVNEENEFNWFMYDNYIHQQRIRKYYSDLKYLVEAYNKSEYFNLTTQVALMTISDQDNLMLALAKTRVKVTEAVANMMLKYTEETTAMVFKFYDPQTEINKLKTSHLEIVEAFYVIGYDEMKKHGFKMHLIEKEVNKVKITTKRLSKEVFEAVHREFANDKTVHDKDGASRLQLVYEKLGIGFKAKASQLNDYYEGRRTTDRKGKHVYPLTIKRKYDESQSNIQKTN